jgi:protein TonB
MESGTMNVPGQLMTFTGLSFVRVGIAVVVAALLNICLFTLMQALISREVAEPEFLRAIPEVTVYQQPRSEKPREKEPVKTVEHKHETQPEPLQKPQNQVQPVPRLDLSFELSPRLPGKPSALRLPPPQTTLAFTPGVGAVFTEGDLDVPLSVIARTPPLYPLRARQRGTEGWVMVRLLVDEQGNVADISILEANPVGVFEESVLRCVRRWRFRPGTVAGQPVKAQVETTVKFALE